MIYQCPYTSHEIYTQVYAIAKYSHAHTSGHIPVARSSLLLADILFVGTAKMIRALSLRWLIS